MATHSSILAWRIPWTEELGGLQSTGGKESDMTEQIHLHLHLHAPNIGALQYVRQMLTSMKGEINNNTITVGDF